MVVIKLARTYELGLFNEFEKLNIKLDKLLKENKQQSLTVYNLNLTIAKLNKNIKEKDDMIKKLQNDNDRIKK